MTSRLKNILTTSGVSVLSTLIALCLAELLFRMAIYDPNSEFTTDTIWKAQKTNMDFDKKRAWSEIGGTRFREEPISRTLLQKEFLRILFLGDSFTVGAGVKNRDDRFTDIIETQLNRDAIDDTLPFSKVHVFTAAKGGTSPSHWIGFFNAVEPQYKPHVVLAVFFLRDGAGLATSVKLNKRLVNPIREKFTNMPLHDYSFLLRYFYNKLAWREFTASLKQTLISSYLGSKRETSIWRRERESLLAISDACKKKSVPFHLVVFPLLSNLKNYEFHGVEDEIIRFANTHQIPVYSLTPGFLGEEDRSLWVANNDQHPNEKGHRIAANTLLEYMRLSIPELHPLPSETSKQ